MTKEALELSLEALEYRGVGSWRKKQPAITAIKQALANDALEKKAENARELGLDYEPVAYDKTEMNCFVQDLYDKKMQEGKHGHYETMFHVVHQAIKKVPPQRTWVGLTDEEILKIYSKPCGSDYIDYARAIEANIREKNR